ncbi:MAG TPA: glucose-6-phosphate isomerase [Desulfosalsimonadaceae bacterium]|nr:glucose-6-phosphate isomerase [Desulfosalsimonadaceae bacterium]
MTIQELRKLPAWRKLDAGAEKMALPEYHLRNLTAQKNRLQRFSVSGGGIFYDYSRQRVDEQVMEYLFELAESRGLLERFREMTNGAHVNETEDRAALHTAARQFSDTPVLDNGRDVMPEIREVREQIKKFADAVHRGEIHGSTGQPFQDVVVIGIGGSYLGAEFIATALEAVADKGIALHFLSNVDVDNFGRIAGRITPENTLWIVISKSYTTTETMANANLAKQFMRDQGLAPEGHLVTVTSRNSPGDDPNNPALATFHMFDYIGGRFSATSAVGGVPLSLFLGWDRFERLLRGAEEMDQHAANAPLQENAPLAAAMTGIWNNNFLGYTAQGIIPYSSALARLAPHIQQLYMESNGKAVTAKGAPVEVDTGVIIFGEPGTNAQHSFFQLAHQGRPFPLDFIGVLKPHYHERYSATSKGVSNHQELWANLIAQAQALALGSAGGSPAGSFPGNRPSSTIVIDDLSPENIGRLLAFYEARTVFEAFLWDINPFDQFGVELGKTMASDIRGEIAKKNQDPDRQVEDPDPIPKFYIDRLFRDS